MDSNWNSWIEVEIIDWLQGISAFSKGLQVLAEENKDGVLKVEQYLYFKKASCKKNKKDELKELKGNS